MSATVDKTRIERIQERVKWLDRTTFHVHSFLQPRCGWCYGTGEATRLGKVHGRVPLGHGTCPKCAGTGEAEGGAWNVIRLLDDLVAAAIGPQDSPERHKP